MKVKYINNYMTVFDFNTYVIVSDMSRKMRLGGFERNCFLREELLVLNAQAIFISFCFLLE